jgi:hypothetical protein
MIVAAAIDDSGAGINDPATELLVVVPEPTC